MALENKLKISAVTFFTKNMNAATHFYSKIPGFDMVYGNSENSFVTFKINDQFINLEYNKNKTSDFGRIIFHVENVDRLYAHLMHSEISDRIEQAPRDANWGERFFYVRDPDNHQIAFARPI
jgi:catechol 2,3-dioxygenase-like lactoylglutathione lyase family enzyme